MQIGRSSTKRPKAPTSIGVSTPLAWVRTKALTEMAQGVIRLHAQNEHGCVHCSELAGKPVAYPCPTIVTLLSPLDGGV